MNALTFNIVGLPAPQGSKKGFYNPNLGRVQMVESSKKVKPWRQDVKAAALTALETFTNFGTPYAGPLEVTITFYLPRPGYHFRTGKHAGELKDTAPSHVAKKPDLDKLLRSTLDGLKEAGVYRDDAQVAVLHGTKQYASGPAGAEITITPLDPAPASAESPVSGAGAGTTTREGALF